MSCRLIFPLLAAAVMASGQSDPQEFFEKKIRPSLVKNCQSCHNSKVKTAGLDLSSLEGIAQGGQSGALISKDDPKSSLLLRVLSYDERLKMPPGGKLKAEELADFAVWVESGGGLPAATASTETRKAPPGKQFTEEEKNYWAFQKVKDPALPKVKSEAWAKSPVDRFILAKLEEKGLSPNAPADKATLLRRVTFDLTGLPPSEQELKDFLADKSPDAFAKVVDRLLASPRYGERWGRHWLDVARYADSTGNDEDHRYPYAWRYRDYVIDSFNQDIPFDQFVREQIAGDMLPAARPGEINTRGIVATGFLALGAKAVAQQDKKKMLVDIYDEQIDVVSKGFMAVTLSCARCHDHKFDPLLTRDYYSMLTIFANTKNFKTSESHVSSLLFTPLVPKEEFERYNEGRAVADKKKGEIEDVYELAVIRRSERLASQVAAYMLAAARVERGKADPAAVAKEKGLEEDLLKEWVDYLKPSPEVKSHLAAWHSASPEKLAEIAESYQKRFIADRNAWAVQMDRTRTVRRQRMRSMPPKLVDPVKQPFFYEVNFQGPYAVSGEGRDKILSVPEKELVAKLQKELKAIESAMPAEPDMACAVSEGKEGDVVAGKVFIRGDYNSLGEPAPPGFPSIMTDRQPSGIKGSGRMELANWLTSPDHPLTARVFMNRMWHWHFGEGIVRTPDNFGKMGDRPTHPELLDFLASRFVENKWSVKAMHRMLLLSNTYQMSSFTTDEAAAKDPENLLFSRFPRRRLSVEELRDGMLAIDGSIDLTMGGTLQTGFGTDGENSNDRLSLKPEAVKRRMVYLPLRRANLPTMLNLFDFGDATTSASKRAMTTIAPQALFMMNSDFVSERARNLVKATSGTAEQPERLRALYLRILNRAPRPDEVDSGLTYIAAFSKQFGPKRSEADAWFSLTRILLASNEYIYLD